MAGRPRKPTRILELTGRFKKDPQLRRQRALEPEPEPGLGDPPEEWVGDVWAAERGRWAELVAMAAAGVLTRSDRGAAELLCKLWAEERRGTIKAADRKLLLSLFIHFGFTPSSRSKVNVPGMQKPTGNPFAGLG